MAKKKICWLYKFCSHTFKNVCLSNAGRALWWAKCSLTETTWTSWTRKFLNTIVYLNKDGARLQITCHSRHTHATDSQTTSCGRMPNAIAKTARGVTCAFLAHEIGGGWQSNKENLLDTKPGRMSWWARLMTSECLHSLRYALAETNFN